MRAPRLALAALAITVLAGCDWPGQLVRGYAEGHPAGLDAALAAAGPTGNPAATGLARFVFEDWGSLNTDGLNNHTLPWKVVASGIVLRENEVNGASIGHETLRRVLREIGFVEPTSIGNWPGTQPHVDGPIGLLRGTISRGFPSVELEASNIGCAGCHAGVLYDENGHPTGDVWLGLPNTSINLEAYSEAVFNGVAHMQGREERLWEVLDSLYPTISDRERNTIRKHVLPSISDQFEGDWQGRTSALPFVGGSTGLTNGVASIKHMMNLLGEDETDTEVAFTSIPDLGGTLLRSSLLYDGAYAARHRERFRPMKVEDVTDAHRDAIADITTFFIVPALGVEAANVRDAYPGVREVVDALETMRSPRFPGPVDSVLAREGGQIYSDACAQCHGQFSDDIENATLISFPNRLTPQDSMGTDPKRWELMTSGFADVINETDYRRYLDVATTGGYVAQPLTALWATAPYMHNGSVPTLWHLMHPSARPEQFFVGGHMLDFERVGIAGDTDGAGVYRYPASYEPWSTPALYDTRAPGKSRDGHEREFEGLTEAQKMALIEYLKVL